MQGIIVGCDANQEWLLPWWWEHYSATNKYPVVFIDFGMTEQGIAYCKERGICLPLGKIPLTERPLRSQKKRALWEEHYSKALWHRRMIWFKKPFALLASPFPLSLWLDLDCQVQKSLEPLFSCLLLGGSIALCREAEKTQQIHLEKGFIRPHEVNYNCGVIAFRKEAPILHKWTEEITLRNHLYPFDQQALSKALRQDHTALVELPSIFNWSMSQGPNSHAYIQHFHGGILKSLLQRN